MFQGLSLDQAPPEDIPFRFFLTAPLFGLWAGFLMAYKGESILLSNWNFQTIALVHLFTLGFLAMTMMGAFYQMVPVLVGGSVPWIGASRLIHALFVMGVVSFIPGIMTLHPAILTLAIAFLLMGLTFFLVQASVALTMIKATDRPTVYAMRLAVSCLLGTFGLGITFAGNFASWWLVPMDRFVMIGIHMSWGLFGWIMALIMGVGFHVVPMFYLTDPFPKAEAFRVLRLLGLALIMIPVALWNRLGEQWTLVFALSGFLGVGAFIFRLHHMFHHRKRKLVDATLRFWKLGMLSLVLSLASLTLFLLQGSDRWLMSFGVLFLLGFASAVVSGMLYKIAPFIIWFHRCANLIGKVPDIPLLDDILPEKKSKPHFILFVLALLASLGGLWTMNDLLIRLAGLLIMGAFGLLFLNLYQAYRMPQPEIPEEVAKMMKMMEEMEAQAKQAQAKQAQTP